jgi:hypothetical protein
MFRCWFASLTLLQVEGVPSGCYYLSPAELQLQQTAPEVSAAKLVPLFAKDKVETRPFILLLVVADKVAMEEIYKTEYALRFCTIEAGHIVSVIKDSLAASFPACSLVDIDLPSLEEIATDLLVESFQLSNAHSVLYAGQIS